MAGFKHITERRGRYKCVARFHVKPAMFIFENAEEADFETPSVERCKNVEVRLRTLLGESLRTDALILIFIKCPASVLCKKILLEKNEDLNDLESIKDFFFHLELFSKICNQFY